LSNKVRKATKRERERLWAILQMLREREINRIGKKKIEGNK